MTRFLYITILIFSAFSCGEGSLQDKRAADDQNIMDKVINKKDSSTLIEIATPCQGCYEDFDLFEFRGIRKITGKRIPKSYIQIIQLSDSSIILVGYVHKSLIKFYTDSVQASLGYLKMFQRTFRKEGERYSMFSAEANENPGDSVYHYHYLYKDRILKYTVLTNKPSKGRKKLYFEEIKKDGNSEEVSLLNTDTFPESISNIGSKEIYNKSINKNIFFKGGYISNYTNITFNKITRYGITEVSPPKEHHSMHEYRYFPTPKFSIFWNSYVSLQGEPKEGEGIFNIFKK